MKRLSMFGVVGVLATMLAGCPIFDDGRGNNGTGFDCMGNDCFNPGPECTSSSQCGVNETCGDDQKCHTGDCTIWGCATGTCVTRDDQTAGCDDGGSGGSGNAGATGSGASGATGSGATGTGGSGAGAVYCGNPDDCSASETCATDTTCKTGVCGDANVGCIFGYACEAATGLCKPENPAACGADSDCLESGFACVSGLCTAPADQCFDQGQCTAGKCADGKCVGACVKDADCTSSFKCDTALGICSIPAKACKITNDCGGASTVCVDGACVDRSVGGTCMAGNVWVENGCVPDQKATFTCQTDGVQAECNQSSLCLHHGCYISCEGSASGACTGLPDINICKSVTSTSGEHQVCGSSQTLGNECDPQAGLACSAAKICVDGYCK